MFTNNIVNKLKKSLASLLAGLMLLPSLPASSNAFGPSVANPFASLTPPPQVATLVSTSASKKSAERQPQVILIQDLHFNYSVQRNIARLLDFLGQQGVVGSRIAVEGAVGEVDNSLLTEVKNLKVRGELADFLMHNGELTGSQYYSVMSGQPKILQGVEDPAFFQANRDVFRLSYGNRRQASRQISQLRARLETLVPTVCSGSVRRLQSAGKRFEAGRLSMERYWNRLHTLGQSANVPLPVPLENYLLGTPERRSELLLTSDLYQALGDYALAVQAALAKTPVEKNLIRLINEFTLVERALNQHTTLEEIRHVVGRMDQTAALVQLLAKDLKADLGFDVERFKEALRASVDFYVAALMRNEPMLENTLALVRQSNPTTELSNSGATKRRISRPAGPKSGSSDSRLFRPTSAPPSGRSIVLVVGGFHTDYFTRELSRRGVSYAVYAPQVDSHTPADDALYVKRFMGERMTVNEATAWIKAHGGIRGSPRAYQGAGWVPPLRGIQGWLTPLARESERIGSLYGLAPTRFLTRLRDQKRSLDFAKRQQVRTGTLDDLADPAFEDDELVPGGIELKSVLALLLRLSSESDSFPTFPIKEMEFTADEELVVVRNQPQIERVSVETWRTKDRSKFIAIVPREGNETTFKAIIHVDAIRHNPTFKANPYIFWTKFVLHETAEFGMNGQSVSHEVLEENGLDADGDSNITLMQLYKKFSQFIPTIEQELINHHGRRQEAEFAMKAWKYIREQRQEAPADPEKLIETNGPLDEPGRPARPDLHMGNLTPEDIKVISSFARRKGLVPQTGFRPARLQDLEPIDPTRSPDEAVRAHLNGFVITQFFDGGNASRMKKGLASRGLNNVLTATENLALHFLPPGKVLDGVPDPIYWGARTLLRLNQSVRKLARNNPKYGVSELQALKNQRIILHVNDQMLPYIEQDLLDHYFYGFEPENIYILVSRTYNKLVYDAKLKLWVQGRMNEDPDSQSVLGNGTPIEMLLEDRQVYNASSLTGPFHILEPSLLSLLRALYEQDRYSVQGLVPYIRQVRINNIKAWDPQVIELDRSAFIIDRIRHGIGNVIEMVENPPLYDSEDEKQKALRGELKPQKGGLPQVVIGKDQTYLMGPEKLSLADQKSDAVQTAGEKEALSREEPPMLNLMGGAMGLEALAVALPKRLEPGFVPGNDQRGNLQYIEGQYVVLEMTLDLGFRSCFFYVPGAKLEDWKERKLSQDDKAREKLVLMNSDKKFLTLAAYYGFNPAPIAQRHGVTIEDLVKELSEFESNEYGMVDVRSSRSLLEIRGRVVAAEAILKGSTSPSPVNGGALRPTEAHWFAGIAGAGLVLGALVQLPVMLLGILGAFAVAAAGQEIAVVSRAVATRDITVLTSQHPIAWYDFTTQTEDVESVPAIARVFAHAHEMARALTQSRGAVAPRLVAPLTLPLAVLDYAVAGVSHGINLALSKLTRGQIPVPDLQMLKKMRDELPKIEHQLAPTRQALAPPASGAWKKVWAGIQTRAGAVWKNSNARTEAAELAARRALTTAA